MIRQKQLRLYLASALIPCALFLFVFFLFDLAPFGSKSMLISDATFQYIDFASYWRTVLSGENDIFYTFSKTLGGNGFSLAAYYLLSPFNLLYLFSSTENLPLFYTLIFLLKLGLCGLSFFTLSARLYGCSAKNLIFSTSYALMAYIVYFAYHLMWLDGVLILPFVLLGLCNLAEKRSPIIYIASLGYALATNFYIGYMLCIASVLFFVAILVLQNSSIREKGDFCLRFAISSATAGFGTAIVWLPTIFSLLAERTNTNPTSLLLKQDFGLINIIAGFSCGVFNEANASNILPLVFCGTLIPILVMLYFLNGKISLKHKAVSFLLILIFLFSFCFNLPNIVWHGFTTTNSFSYRYSFIFSFLLILMAQYQFHSNSGGSKLAVLFSAALIAAGLVYTTATTAYTAVREGIAVTLAAIALSALCMLVLQKKRRLCSISLFLILAIELTVNCTLCWNNLLNVVDSLDRIEFSAHVEKTQPALDYLETYDPGFYRIEKTYYRTWNDSSLFNYAGLSHFSSTELVKTKAFMRKMGFSSHYNFWVAYLNGSTAETESFLGMKYLLSDGSVPITKAYDPVATVNGITIYENKSALPVCFLANDKIRSVSPVSTEPFELHNQIWQGIAAKNQDIFTDIPYDVSISNLSATTNPDGSITYSKVDPEEPAFVRYTIPVSHELPLYYYFTAADSEDHPNSPEDQDVTVFINGEDHGRYFHYLSWNMSCAGTFEPGDTVVIDLVPNQDVITISGAWFCHENESVLREYATSIQQQELQFTKTSSSRLQGTFTAQNGQILLFTIPQETGWHLEIDGIEADTYTVLDSLMAADIPAGEHYFELYFTPPGFLEGSILTCMTVILYVGGYLILKKRRC